MPPATLSVERKDRVAIVRFRRGEQLNAISTAMLAEITTPAWKPCLRVMNATAAFH